VNIGTMGFMAELECTELDQLARLAKGDYTIDSRMMLDVTVTRERNIIFHEQCLNDVVITKGAVARIVHLSVACDGVLAMECGGDGVIVATPTGSTAYSLSAGSPIMEPETRSVLVTPICAHDMASRSMVVSDKRTVQITLTKNARRNAFLSVDGGRSIKLNMGDVATVKRSSMETKLIRLKDRSFYEIVNQKFRSY
jgi:NAD+ kinase